MAPVASKMGPKEVYEVQEILDKRIIRGITEYYLKWKGFSSDSNTWEPAANINCNKLIKKYEMTIKKQEKKTKKLSEPSRKSTMSISSTIANGSSDVGPSKKRKAKTNQPEKKLRVNNYEFKAKEITKELPQCSGNRTMSNSTSPNSPSDAGPSNERKTPPKKKFVEKIDEFKADEESESTGVEEDVKLVEKYEMTIKKKEKKNKTLSGRTRKSTMSISSTIANGSSDVGPSKKRKAKANQPEKKLRVNNDEFKAKEITKELRQCSGNRTMSNSTSPNGSSDAGPSNESKTPPKKKFVEKIDEFEADEESESTGVEEDVKLVNMNSHEQHEYDNNATFESTSKDQKVAEKILGATDSNEELKFWVRWKDIEKPELVPATEANVLFPQMVIGFYQERLIFFKNSDDSEDSNELTLL